MTRQLWTLLLFLCALAARCDGAEADTAIHGTLISAFGNGKGLVVVTDSMGTLRDASGQVNHQSPFQKLLKYDDHTVCAIAGALILNVPDAPNLNSAMLGIISRYRDQNTAQGLHPTMKSALSDISALLQFYLQSIAEINADTRRGVNTDDYSLEVLMVGYDLDGLAKIGELEIKVKVDATDPVKIQWKASEVEDRVTTVGKQLTYKLKGMKEVAALILEHPELRKDNRIVKAYADAQKSDSGESFTLPQMEELQGEMVRITADIHDEVGGDKQVAVLEGGHISRFEQPPFAEPSRPFGLAIFHGGGFSGSSFDSGARGLGMDKGSEHGSGLAGVVIRGNVVMLFDSVHFKSVGAFPGEPLLLDGNVFVNCIFENTNVIYYGGSLYLDETNQVINSHVLWGSNPDRHPDIVRKILERHFLN